MVYNILLFIHILGTVVMFVAVGITLTAMVKMLTQVRRKLYGIGQH